MPILNYTTSIDAFKTVGEVQKVLVKHGAKSVNVDYDDAGNPAALTFMIELEGRFISFRLPSQWQGVRKSLEKSKAPKRLKTDAQAIRVAWRILKTWCEAQMAIIEAGLAELPEVFLPYAVRSDGQTMYHSLKSNPRLLEE
jgi:hypothetical protein